MKKKNCYACGKINLSKTEIALTKKLIGLNTTVFYCLPCLAEVLEVDTDFLLDRLEEYKDEGCILFE